MENEMKNFTQIPNKVLMCPSLTASEFRILLILMSLKPCYPSYADLSKRTGMTGRTINRTLQKLKNRGVISWVKGNSHGKNNYYSINFRALSKLKSDYGQNGHYTTDKMAIPTILIREESLKFDYSDDEIRELEASRLTVDPKEQDEWFESLPRENWNRKHPVR